jgi:hypothetical protein
LTQLSEDSPTSYNEQIISSSIASHHVLHWQVHCSLHTTSVSLQDGSQFSMTLSAEHQMLYIAYLKHNVVVFRRRQQRQRDIISSRQTPCAHLTSHSATCHTKSTNYIIPHTLKIWGLTGIERHLFSYNRERVTANSRQPEDRPWSDLSTVLDLITVAIDPRNGTPIGNHAE